MPKPNETGYERFGRIKDHESCNRNDPVSFNVKATKDGFIFNTEQHHCDDVIEMQCDHMWQLFDYLFDDYPSILELCKSVPNPVRRKPGKKQHFLMLPDEHPKEGQEPFLLIEYLNYECTPFDRKCYDNLDHFVKDVILKTK